MFEKWNKSELDSYLIEITAEILRYKDEDGHARVEKILDSAGQVCQDLLLPPNLYNSTILYRKAPANGRASRRSSTASRSH